MSLSESFSDSGSEPMNTDASAPLSSASLPVPEEASTPVDEVVCWRCGKVVAIAARCRICQAQLITEEFSPSLAVHPDSKTPTHPVVRLTWVYFGMLATLLVYFAIADSVLARATDENNDVWTSKFVMEGVFYYINLMFELGALLWIGRPAPLPTVSARRRWISWILATPALFALLALNVAFSNILKWYMGNSFIEIEVLPPKAWIPIAIITICILPAVLEEFFFRLLALGTLNTVCGIKSALLISSVMFGVAHIGNPLAIPYLILTGLVFGCFRVASGGLMLPILLHLCHNCGVLFLESFQ